MNASSLRENATAVKRILRELRKDLDDFHERMERITAPAGEPQR